jgi:hypothetical protein
MRHSSTVSRLALFLACAVPLAVPASALAQARKTGRVYSINTTARDSTITITAWYDAFGTKQSIKGGSWSVKAFSNGYLNDLGKPFYASRVEFTITTTEGSTNWYSTAFDRFGNLTVTVDADVLKRHLAMLPGRVMPVAPVVVAPRPVVPAAGPTKAAVERATGKIIGAILANAIAKSPPKPDEGFGAAFARALAIKARDELIESALKDVFPGRPLREIQAARIVICLQVDGKLTVRNFNRAQAREDILTALKRYDTNAGSAAEVADFIYDVMEGYRRRR